MKLRAIGIRRFLQVSSGLIILGLLVEIASFLWFHFIHSRLCSSSLLAQP
jgi:hypothetical protein